MSKGLGVMAAAGLIALAMPVAAQGTAPAPAPAFDEALAARTGADEHGMRRYVLVVLRTGPNRMPNGPERDAMFRGHFAHIQRLVDEGKLVLAGPFDGVDGWRGLFVFAVPDIEEARRLASTDPVLASGEMVAEYHRYFGSAALVLVPELHRKVSRKAL